MPPTRHTICKLPDCDQPVHVYPGGWRTPYCQQHMRRKKAKQRPGFDTMSGQMQDVLTYLRSMKKQGYEWVELAYPLAHGRTIKCLIKRDWIFESPGPDGIRYKITGRGLNALVAYEKPMQRRDGICPTCGKKPRHVRSSGQLDSHCNECERARGRLRRKLGNDIGDPNRPCSRCREKERHVYPNGKISTYCKPCEQISRRENARKQRQRMLVAVKAGGPVPMCKKCKKNPRRVFANSISEYCDECRLPYMRKYKLQRVLQRHGVEVY